MKKIIKISKSKLKKLYEKDELTMTEIAIAFNCSKSTIFRRLKKFKIKIKGKSYYKNIPKNELINLYLKKGLSIITIAKKYNCNEVTIFNRLKEYGIKIKDPSDRAIRTPKYNFSGDLIEKAYLIGFRLGDLHARKYGKNGKIINVSCGSSNKNQVNLIRNLFNKYCKVTVSKPNKRGIMHIIANLNDSFNFLLKKEDDIDSFILNNKKRFFAFLAGYTDAEGCIGIHKQGFSTFRIRTYDRNILQQLKNKLLCYGFSSVKLSVNKSNQLNKQNNDYWGLCIYKKHQLLKLYKQILPLIKHEDKKNAIIDGIKNINSRNEKYGYLRMREV